MAFAHGSRKTDSKTVLVTGAAGFIGSHTVERLLRDGHRVVGVDNFRTGNSENLASARNSQNYQFVELDLLDQPAFERTMRAVLPDAVIHLAALVSVPESIENPAENFRLNVLATERVADCVRRHGVNRLVFSSSAAVYGNDSRTPAAEDVRCEPRSPYGAAKLACEALLLGYARTFRLTVRCQRYFNVYGPRQDPRSPYSGVISLFANACLAEKLLRINGDGQQTRDFVAVEDVAVANVLAATADGVSSGIANVCTGQATSLIELADTFERLGGRSLVREHGEARAGDIRHSVGSTERAIRELGFHADTSLEKGLADLMGYLRA